MATDPQKNIHDLVLLLLEELKLAREAGVETEEIAGANSYLYQHVQAYRTLLRRRILTSTYEFLTPPADDGRRAGWYWRHPKHKNNDWVNWHGPFSSRKEAAEDRIKHAKRGGAPTLKIEVLDRELGL